MFLETFIDFGDIRIWYWCFDAFIFIGLLLYI